MITIKTIKTNEGLETEFIKPERVLTAKEKATVTSMLCNGVEYIYYQGDEPKQS